MSAGDKITKVVIEPAAERTLTAAKLEIPFIHNIYSELRTNGSQGKNVLVVGSGPNTNNWRGLGCKTLDIDPASKPDFVADANKLDTVISPNSFDVIVSECVRLDPTGKRGVDIYKFLPQVYESLSDGGRLFFVTAYSTSEPDRPSRTLLTPDIVKTLMKKAGFINVASWHGEIVAITDTAREIGDKSVISELTLQSAMIYHGQKAR